MRSFLLPVLVLATLALVAPPCFAADVPLLDGHKLHGKVTGETADGLELEGEATGGGTFKMKVSANDIAPQWWYDRRDAAIGDDAQGRLDLAVWAVEHGLFQQAKDQFEKATKLDAALAAKFQGQVLPGLRAGIASDLLAAARRTMDAQQLDQANKMVHAVLTRFGDTDAAAGAKTLLKTLQEKIDAHVKELAHWKKFGDDEAARELADQRKKITEPIEGLIRQGHRILADAPPAAAQADAVTHTRQAAAEFKTAIEKVDQAVKAHGDDKELVEKLQALGNAAQKALVQCYVTAGDVYASTGNYQDAAKEARTLSALDPAEAHALDSRISEYQSMSGSDINYGWRRGRR